jgi:hypothetical protein
MNLIGILGNAGAGKDSIGGFIVEATRGKTLSLAEPMKQFAMQTFGFSHDTLFGPSQSRNFVHKEYATEHTANVVIKKLQGQDTLEWLASIFPEKDPEELHLVHKSLVQWGEDLLDQAALEGGLSARKTLQTLGTEWGRGYSPDVWVNHAVRRAKAMLQHQGVSVVAITDCRFLNEARVLSGIGHVWRVTRPGYDGSVAGGISGHASERDQQSDEIKQYVSLEVANDGTLSDLRIKTYESLSGLGVSNGVTDDYSGWERLQHTAAR